MATSLLVVGSLNMDMVVQVKTQPRPGETVLGSDTRTFPGGKGANQAVAAARAGARVRLLGRVGSDAYGQSLRASASEAGVDTDLLEEGAEPSGVAFITVSEDGENMIVVSSGANARLRPEAVRDEHLEGVGLVLMQLEIPLETVVHTAHLARGRGLPVILNAAPAQRLPESLLKDLTHLVVNESEAAFLAGQGGGLEEVAQRLRAKGVRNVVVTLGSEGALLLGEEGMGQVAAHRIEVRDTTAAGDAFCGALCVALVEGQTLAEAVRFANAAGALATTREGAQPSLPTRRAIEELLNA